MSSKKTKFRRERNRNGRYWELIESQCAQEGKKYKGRRKEKAKLMFSNKSRPNSAPHPLPFRSLVSKHHTTHTQTYP
ncbi:unnamed protein product [Periconia digitata]|uniref:Uncharacterized protein n=1 Tax=Periconia digitata TaxID=1303443 RepID=A0A9W4U801_9PLEO|nr:unnamed protein product [Periconia digitata]